MAEDFTEDELKALLADLLDPEDMKALKDNDAPFPADSYKAALRFMSSATRTLFDLFDTTNDFLYKGLYIEDFVAQTVERQTAFLKANDALSGVENMRTVLVWVNNNHFPNE